MNLREKATEARRFFSKSAWSGARTLVAALFAVAAALAASVPAFAHSSHPGEACPAGKSRLTKAGSPCVLNERVEVLEWCNKQSGFTVRKPDGTSPEIYSGYPGRSNNNQIFFANEKDKHVCFIGKSRRIIDNPFDSNYNNIVLPEATIRRCTDAGFHWYVDHSELFHDSVEEEFYYCMPPKDSRTNRFSTTFDKCYRDSLRSDSTGKSEKRWHLETHGCLPRPSAPRDVSIRVVARNTVEISWTRPTLGHPNSYVIQRTSDLVNVHTTPTTPATADGRLLDAVTARFRAPGGNYKYKVISRSNKNFQSPSGPERAAETEAVDAESDRDICTGAGWQSAFEKCPVPLINIRTGETADFCRHYKNRDLPDNHKDNVLCFDDDVFGDAGGRGVGAFPPYEAGVRYVYDCPVGTRSADYKICECPNTRDYTQVGKECHVNQDCDAQFREQVDSYTCGVCVADSTLVGGECLPHRNCVADENRAAGDELYTCGACLAGHREYARGDERLCRPDLRILPNDLRGYCADAGGTVFAVESDSGNRAGEYCEFAPGSGKESCYSLDYRSAGADEAGSELKLYRFSGGDNLWSAGTCDDDYPVCAGTGFVNQNDNPLKACVCPTNHVETTDSSGAACRFDCVGVHFRENGAELSTCGACLPAHVEHELGGNVCQPVIDCEADNRQQINAYTCGGCRDGYGADSAGVCQMATDCSSEGKVQLTPYSCGGCAAGYTRDSAGECKPIPCPSGFADANGNCPETPQAEQCLGAAADGASLKRWGAKLDDGRCLPVQTCLFGTGTGALTPLRQAAASSQMTGCHLWSDTGRPGAGFRTMTVIAGMTVKASVSYLRDSGECSGEQMEGEFAVDSYANPTLYAPSCHAGLFNCPAGLKDPNNPFSLCNPNLDHDQTNCEAAEGVWKEITSQPDDPASLERADSCKIGADVCYTGAKKNFDETVGTFYDYRSLRNRPGEHLTPVERDAQYPLSGYVYTTVIVACETEYPSDCGSGVLRVPGNPFSGCSSIPLTNPGVPQISASSDGATLEWAPSGGDAANSVLGYSVWRETDGAAFVSIAFTTGTIYADAGAQPESMVRYRVSAHVPSDDVLVSDPSEAIRIPGCLLDEHTAISRSGLPPLCVPDATPPSAAQKCADAGWNVLYRESAPSHVRCNVSVWDEEDGSVKDNCGLRGNYEVACSDVFGEDFDFPTNDGVSRRFVFNCDPDNNPPHSVPDPEYVKYAGYSRQECVCAAGRFDDVRDNAREGECTLCSDLNRASLSVAGQGCGDCIGGENPDGTCNFDRPVRATPSPSDGGIVVVSGVSGGAAPNGAYVTFTATPNEGRYLDRWGDSRCADTGGTENTGAAKECILRVNGDVDLTVYFSKALEVVFSGAGVSARRTAADGGGAVNSGDLVTDGVTIVFSVDLAVDFAVDAWLNGGAAIAACGREPSCALAVAGADVSVAAALREVRRVAWSGAPANGAGGAVTVAGLESGDIVTRGSSVTFSAVPIAEFYVSGWSHSDCADVGSLAAPGEAKECILAATEHLDVKVTFADGGEEPSAPRNFAAALVAAGDRTTVTLTWLPPPNAHPPVTEWIFQRASVAADNPQACVATDFSGQFANHDLSAAAEDFSTTDSPLAYGWCHGYRMAAVNLRGTGAWTAGENVYVFAPPSPPRDVSAAFARDSVSVAWTAPAQLNGATIDRYEIFRETNGTGGFLQIGESPSSPFVDLIPPSSSTVRYRARALSNAGPSDFSDPSGEAVIPMFSHRIAFSHQPSDGGGGTLTALNFSNGSRTESGQAVTFVATPAAGWVVSGWSGAGAEDCPRGRRDGDAWPTGEAASRQCAVTPPSDSHVTVFFTEAAELDGNLRSVVATSLPEAGILLSVQALLAAGADPNTANKVVIEDAADKGHASVVRELLRGGADPNGVANRRAVPHIAARNGDTAAGLRVLRAFILGLQDAGRLNYDWSRRHSDDTPLDLLAWFHHDNLNNSNVSEIRILLYERGGRCLHNPTHPRTSACREIPIKQVNVVADDAFTGEAHRELPRNLVEAEFGGVEFALTLSEPDVLQQRGWSARRSDDGVIISRARTGLSSDVATEFTVTATKKGDDEAVLLYRFNLSVNFVPRPPEAPGNFAASISGVPDAPRATLTWTAPFANYSDLQDYRFWSGATMSSSPDCSGADFGDWLSSPSASVGLSGVGGDRTSASEAAVYGECRVYALAAVNAQGAGATVRATVYIQHPPSPPQDLSATADADAVSLQWAAPERLRGAAISGYEILRESNGADGFVSVAFSSGLTHTELNPPITTTVRYKVRAQSGAGPGEDSQAATVYVEEREAPEEPKAPGAPGDFAASTGGEPDAPRATLTWTAPSGNPADLQDYRFWSGAAASSSPDCSGADFGDWLSSPSASAGLSGVGGERTSASEAAVYGECRVYALAAVNAAGAGATVRATVYIQHPPSPPRDLSATADGAMVSLQWAAPERLRGAAISGYEILRESNGADGFVSVAFSSGLTHTELNPPITTTVRYKVRAQSGAGPGEDSQAATVYVEEREAPEEPKAPGAPGDFAASTGGEPDAPRATLTWTAPSDDPADLQDYRFWSGAAASSSPDCSGADFGDWLSSPSASAGLSGVGGERTSASEAAVYGECRVYALAAVNAQGAGATVRATVYIQHPPSPPQDLSATATADGATVSLQWSAPANLRGANISGYEILRNAVGTEGFQSAGFSAGLTHLDSNAPKGATVQYKVRAHSSAGPGEDSQAATVAIGGVRDCSAENRLPAAGDGGCGACADDFGEIGGYCIPSAGDSMGDFGSIPQAEICQALRLPGDSDSDIRVCSGVDANDTFCMMDSADAFPCRGLLRHILKCNLGYNRVALNPFFCGKICVGQKAVGSKCR